jgi:hypothetical protein
VAKVVRVSGRVSRSAILERHLGPERYAETLLDADQARWKRKLEASDQ